VTWLNIFDNWSQKGGQIKVIEILFGEAGRILIFFGEMRKIVLWSERTQALFSNNNQW